MSELRHMHQASPDYYFQPHYNVHHIYPSALVDGPIVYTHPFFFFKLMIISPGSCTLYLLRTSAVIMKTVLCSSRDSYSQYCHNKHLFNTLQYCLTTIYNCARVMIYNPINWGYSEKSALRLVHLKVSSREFSLPLSPLACSFRI